jgi:hypothetical protein
LFARYDDDDDAIVQLMIRSIEHSHMPSSSAVAFAGYFPILDPSECDLFLEKYGPTYINLILNSKLSTCQICVNITLCATEKDCYFSSEAFECMQAITQLRQLSVLPVSGKPLSHKTFQKLAKACITN